MAMTYDCPGCQQGDHTRHISLWDVHEGLLGGTVCQCNGDCKSRQEARVEHFQRELGAPISASPGRAYFMQCNLKTHVHCSHPQPQPLPPKPVANVRDIMYAAYAQGHKDACVDTDCVLRPDSTYLSYGQGWIDGAASKICGLSGNYGVHMEPLACAYPPNHQGSHAWESLPTFVNGNL